MADPDSLWLIKHHWPAKRVIVPHCADGVRQVYFQDPDGHWIEINDANAEP